MASARRGALDDASDVLDPSGAHATLHVVIVHHGNPCPIASRACPGDLHIPSPPEAQKRKVHRHGATSLGVEQDMDASEVDMNSTPYAVRVRPVTRPGASRLDSQPGILCTGRLTSSAPGEPYASMRACPSMIRLSS